MNCPTYRHVKRRGICQGWCDSKKPVPLEKHHIHPRWLGGKNEPSNYQFLCYSCHLYIEDLLREVSDYMHDDRVITSQYRDVANQLMKVVEEDRMLKNKKKAYYAILQALAPPYIQLNFQYKPPERLLNAAESRSMAVGA